MGVAENKEMVRRFYKEVWDRGNVEFAHEVFADDYVRHDLRPTEADAGGAGMVKIAADFRRAFPDARWQIDLVFGEGDFVAFGLMEQVGAHVYAGAAPPKIPAED